MQQSRTQDQNMQPTRPNSGVQIVARNPEMEAKDCPSGRATCRRDDDKYAFMISRSTQLFIGRNITILFQIENQEFTYGVTVAPQATILEVQVC